MADSIPDFPPLPPPIAASFMIISSFPAALGVRDTGTALCASVIHTLIGSGPGEHKNPDAGITSTG